ncbi:MAG: hypothetical protein LUH58_08810 [Lachnospiraceae bacterium]|nr:hypothetical protein [Lachnospiraceae bacterium]
MARYNPPKKKVAEFLLACLLNFAVQYLWALKTAIQMMLRSKVFDPNDTPDFFALRVQILGMD